ncbi:MAG: hypothetical protein ACR2G3_03380 [Solirubrobacterales bacterium]
MTARKNIARTTIALIAALALGAGVATAHTTHFDSKLTAHFTEQPGPLEIDGPGGRDYFSGRVVSPKPACTRKPVVRVYLQQPGTDPHKTAMSDADGIWWLYSEDPPNGTYYARAGRKVLKNTSAHTHLCKRARSRDFVVTGQP